jgi:pyridoxamine 5'-phosphate oxidase
MVQASSASGLANDPSRADRRQAGATPPIVPQDGADPFEIFAAWFDAAVSSGIAEPEAMTLATASEAGLPSARIVLLKDFDVRGFVFYTNYESRKGRELQKNPSAALVFYWQPLGWQIRIEGSVERASPEESRAYFRTRPLESRLGAWASAQSTVIDGHETLERRREQVREQMDGHPALPPFWGGCRVVPASIEFWIADPYRLHRRMRYRRRGGSWLAQSLAP